MADDTQTMSLQAPQDNVAEQSVLGSVLISTDPTDTMATISPIIQPNDFFRTAHRVIFAAMLALDDQQQPIDQVTLVNQLNAMNQLENAGGEAYLVDLALAVPIASNAEYYAKIVKDKAQRRSMIDLLQGATQEAYGETDAVEDALAKISQGLDGITTNRAGGDFKRIADVVNRSFEQLELNARTEGNITGLASGYPALDNMTTGFGGGEMIIVAARPAVGKTAFVLNIARNVAINNPALPVVIFSLEMGDTDLVNRMLASTGNINSQHMRTGELDDNEWQQLTIAMGSLANTKIFIDDTPGIKVTEIRSKLRRLEKQEGQLGMVIIDYLQLIEGSGSESRQQEVSAISRAIKKMAMELNTPVIALSQLSRGVEQRQDKRPVMSDIRESGSIEQDADIVAFLYREDYYERDNDDTDNQSDPREGEDADVGEIEIILEKNRRGARGTARLLFVKSYNKFSSIDYRPDMTAGFG
ncbi:DNA helicase [Weissella oryzae SG25]|uniref:Replicative DNA helicase n=1 Tax=Weissella oryzae (strain DSM 25784 / JCM 18191 / LMG 30913 / SG25) TaxID=1329250 RepID=A0A069CU25_WEIOS|nr:replicative DNA helicase [Weissella oryzae]GAK30892.1 DNA helicase [Weissella oryzae SG25]